MKREHDRWLATLTTAERERFEERAAIHEYDGGLAREEAERKARESVERPKTGAQT